MPRIVVRMNPDGSLLPGMMNFAMMPARKPMMIVQMMPNSAHSIPKVNPTPDGDVGSVGRGGTHSSR